MQRASVIGLCCVAACLSCRKLSTQFVHVCQLKKQPDSFRLRCVQTWILGPTGAEVWYSHAHPRLNVGEGGTAGGTGLQPTAYWTRMKKVVSRVTVKAGARLVAALMQDHAKRPRRSLGLSVIRVRALFSDPRSLATKLAAELGASEEFIDKPPEGFG